VCFRKIVSIIAVVTAQFDVPEVGGEEVFAEFLNYQTRDSSHKGFVALK
jgi:hypothetical protein